jgi:hypothetical protein
VARLRAVAKQDGNRVCADCTEKVFAVCRACVRPALRLPAHQPACVWALHARRAAIDVWVALAASGAVSLPNLPRLQHSGERRPRAPRAPSPAPRRRVQRPRLCVRQCRVAQTVASDTSARQVCMGCSGLHREFQHKCKGISMSKWTADEVKAVEAGGNLKAERCEPPLSVCVPCVCASLSWRRCGGLQRSSGPPNSQHFPLSTY